MDIGNPTDKEMAELMDGLRHERYKYKRRLAWKGLRIGLSEWKDIGKNDYSLSATAKIFYLVKCFLCVMFCLRVKTKHGAFPNEVDISCPYYETLYAGWEQEVLVVGHGVCSGWWYEVVNDGDWNM